MLIEAESSFEEVAMPVIEVSNLSYAYTRNGDYAVADVSFAIGKG